MFDLTNIMATPSALLSQSGFGRKTLQIFRNMENICIFTDYSCIFWCSDHLFRKERFMLSSGIDLSKVSNRSLNRKFLNEMNGQNSGIDRIRA